MPLNAASAITCATRTRPVKVSAARMNALSISSVWVPISRWRRLMRSITTPAKSPTRSIGRNCAKETTPSIIEELVSFITSHDCAALCIQVPASEVSWPKK